MPSPGISWNTEYLDILPAATGWTRISPGRGFLRDLFTTPYLVHWQLQDGWATSEQLPRVRIPVGCFMGTAGLAPSRAQLEAWNRREAELAARNALLNMIALLQERGWSREQASVLCSVAVDLRVSNIVDLPNVVVSAFLPEDIFTA